MFFSTSRRVPVLVLVHQTPSLYMAAVFAAPLVGSFHLGRIGREGGDPWVLCSVCFLAVSWADIFAVPSRWEGFGQPSPWICCGVWKFVPQLEGSSPVSDGRGFKHPQGREGGKERITGHREGGRKDPDQRKR
jgi:hypothetical protein